MADASELVEDLFRRESARLVAALTRLLGPSNLPLAEDVVHDTLMSAMAAWRFELPRDPKAWLRETAKNRAIDRIRREQRFSALRPVLESEWVLASTPDALSESEDAKNQLAMMFSLCDEALSHETHVTLILRLLCGLSPAEIARAFLVGTETVDRRLHRGRARLRALGRLDDATNPDEVARHQGSVMHALYLLFNEGYHGSDAENPLLPALCTDAIRLAELLLESPATTHVEVHALAALFCFNAARLPTRLDDEGVLVPLADQDRGRWDRALVERGVLHLSASSSGDRLTRWHLEAGIACEHALAPSVTDTNWARIVDLYDALRALAPGPIVALNRAIAVAELRGLDEGRRELVEMQDDAKVSQYHFFWGALADIERRGERPNAARPLYERAISLCRSDAEHRAYERKLRELRH